MVTCSLLDRLGAALATYPNSFYLLVEWFASNDEDRFMAEYVDENGYIEVSDLPDGPTRQRYKALAFLVSLGFELRRQCNRDVLHYHRVSPDHMFRLRRYIRCMRCQEQEQQQQLGQQQQQQQGQQP
jgi:hypothetical protein